MTRCPSDWKGEHDQIALRVNKIANYEVYVCM